MTGNIIEDEENWLYADDTEQILKNEKESCAYTSGEISEEISFEMRQSTSNEDPTPGFESDLEDFEPDSDDDGIVVSIGNTFTHNTPNIKINGGLLAAKSEKPQAQLKKFVVEDFTKPGNIDGTPVGEFNIDNIVEKPWRQPGADISDYFNYNFNEDTWMAYCERQKRIRLNESGSSHLQTNTTHCAIPVVNGHPNVPLGVIDNHKKIDNSAVNPDRPESHGLLVYPDMSKPPPMINLEQFKLEHPNNLSYASPRPPISSSSSSSRSNSNPRSSKSVREENSNFRKNDSKKRDLSKRRERSRERPNKKNERREKSRSRSRRSRSRSRSHRDRYYGNNRSRRGYN